MTTNNYEKQFIEIYGIEKFYEIYNFIKENDILDCYNKARDNPIQLCRFGFHYGIISIVAFCYCGLKLSLNIHDEINGYFKTVNSTTPELIDNATNREIYSYGVPIIHSQGANDGICIATIDKFTPGRTQCMKYLLRMIRFSKYTIVKNGPTDKIKYSYKIVDKYINDYQLLAV
jgi:hypothetical protein